ncbi:MAG: NAD-dependent dihydropyrimidine dehydrogenase subunit PreA [Myxococcales bacterium]|nr:NAD-dependent dihydropyrimidine dehydrogenase subunit PreA [Myxococcales bacterium]
MSVESTSSKASRLPRRCGPSRCRTASQASARAISRSAARRPSASGRALPSRWTSRAHGDAAARGVTMSKAKPCPRASAAQARWAWPWGTGASNVTTQRSVRGAGSGAAAAASGMGAAVCRRRGGLAKAAQPDGPPEVVRNRLAGGACLRHKLRPHPFLPAEGSMADLSIDVNGMKFENPFVIGSGPPGTNANVIARCFEAGWGGVVAKTCALTDTEVINVSPRYGKLRAAKSNEVIGFQNIELISDRPFEDWEADFREIKASYPNKILIASLMESFSEKRWQELTRRSVTAGVDGFELNFSCPHGHPETGMGAAMGQNPMMVEAVTRWVKAAADGRPVWSKLTPNITDIRVPARAAFAGGADGVSAINTILSIIGIDLKTLRPVPTVEGHSVPGGYSAQAVKPIGLRMVQEIALDRPGCEISGIGGVWNSTGAIEFLLVGASTVQVCTGAMLLGYEMVDELKEGLAKFLADHKFANVRAMVGASLPYFTTHHHLVELQAEKRAQRTAANRDLNWGKERITDETARLTSNETAASTAGGNPASSAAAPAAS